MGWPDAQSAPHWRGETSAFLAGARRAFTPSMRHRIDLPGLYADALEAAREASGGDLHGVGTEGPFALNALVTARPDLEPNPIKVDRLGL